MQEQLLTLWPDEDAVAECIKHEAETVDKAVFLAVHQPMRFIRVDEGAKKGAQKICTEQDLLDEFLQEKLPEGRLILPIEGSSGVGKSHVIRWIDAQLARRPDRAKRHIIRVPKGMSLKGVLRLLLHGLEGPRYEEFRAQLLGARDKLDGELSASYLIANIRYRLRLESEAAKARMLEGEKTKRDKTIKAFGAPSALPMLLGDSGIEEHWLTREDGTKGAMTKLAEQITDEATGPDDTRQHQIRPEDLLLPTTLIGQLNPKSQRFYARMTSGDGERLKDAASCINRVLDSAKQDLLQLGDGSLTDLFREVRGQLYLDGKELILLVEDFAVLSGMQGALLQVMITEAYRDGEQVLCTMRSALAYTEGVAHVPETVRTRARSLWTIEDRPGNEEDIHRRVVELVGAYLNAARVGQQGLREAFKNADDMDRWIPARSGQDLEDEVKATLESFGRSEARYLLFPFNRGAIRQLTEQGSRKEGNLVFNPRNIINNVLGKVLHEREAFKQGTFPHLGLVDSLRSSEVTQKVVRSITDREKQRQTLSLLACWGGQPNALVEAATLSERVFASFGLERPAWNVVLPPPPRLPPPPDSVIPPPPIISPPPAADPKEKAWKDALESWGAGQQLSQQHARQLRKCLAQAMLSFVPWGMLPMKPTHNADHLQSQVYLPRARGQGGLEPDDAFLLVANEADLNEPAKRSAVIRTLLAFMRLHDLKKTWEYKGALEDAALCASFLDARASSAEAYLRAHHFRVKGDVTPALTEVLLVGARALGVKGAGSQKLTARLDAIFGNAEPPDESGDTRWGRHLGHLFGHRDLLRKWLLERIGARQGKGAAVHAVDVTAIELIISETAKFWSVRHTLPKIKKGDASRVAVGLQELKRDLSSTLQQQRQKLLEWHAAATAWFGEDLDRKKLREQLLMTVKVAKKELPLQYNYQSLRADIDALKTMSLKRTLDHCIRLEKNQGLGDVLAVLADKPDPVVRATEKLMKSIDKFLTLYEVQVTVHIKQTGLNAVGESSTAVRQELTQLRGLLQTIEEVGS